VTGEIVALKKVKLHDSDEGVPSCTIREVSLLKQLDHPYIVRLHNVVFSSTLYLVFEFLDLDLSQYMKNYARLRKGQGKVPVLDPRLIKSYMLQMLDATYFCHKHRIMHRDLKPSNLLVTKDGRLKIADFGLARAYSIPLHTYTHEVITLWYRAPEILLGGKVYTPSVDIWSIGCIFAELVTFEPLFPGDSEIDELFSIFKILGTPTEETWPGVSKLPYYKSTFPKWKPRKFIEAIKKLDRLDPLGIDLLEKMLIFEPGKRISARDALKHPYFADMRGMLQLSLDETDSQYTA